MKKKVKISFFLAIVISVFIVIYLFLNNLACQRLACLSLRNGSQYKIKKIYEDDEYTFRALYGKDDTLLRAEIRNNFSAAESEQAIQSQITRTKGMFEDAQSPYPDEISDVISCGKEYQPVYSAREQNGIKISYFTGFVNERLVFGSCISDQAIYSDTLTMFYCSKQKRFYQLEIITPNKNSAANLNQRQEVIDSIACKE